MILHTGYSSIGKQPIPRSAYRRARSYSCIVPAHAEGQEHDERVRLSVVKLLQLAHVRPGEVRREKKVQPQRSKVQERREQPPQLQLEDGRLPVEEEGARPLVVVEDGRDDGDADAHLQQERRSGWGGW